MYLLSLYLVIIIIIIIIIIIVPGPLDNSNEVPDGAREGHRGSEIHTLMMWMIILGGGDGDKEVDNDDHCDGDDNSDDRDDDGDDDDF